jgi:hypothetical protein
MKYKIQIDDLVRDATPDEIAALEKVQGEKAERELVAAQNAVDKAELLNRLGISADEAALLLS